ISGIRRGTTTGAPLTLLIANRVSNIDSLKPIHRPRPGHADLAGMLKYGTIDARALSERASARETAARVAVGALAKEILRPFHILLCGFVTRIGALSCPVDASTSPAKLRRARDESIFYFPRPALDRRTRTLVDRARSRGTTLGGIVEIRAFGVPPGLGSSLQWEEKLDGAIARALLSVQTVKGVEFGLGFDYALRTGAETMDIIAFKGGRLRRFSNNCGGIEGGMSNGEPIVVRAVAKPIPTQKTPLPSVDMKLKKNVEAAYERSDICAVPALSVVAEAVVGFEIARAFLEKFGGDTFSETRCRYRQYGKQLERMTER
ncbi:MAG: chorismate synthase, partial [Planctomycetes bacterium RBG_16_59_8]